MADSSDAEREFTSTLFHEASAIGQFLASEPTPQQILDVHASPELQRRLEELIARSKAGLMTPSDAEEWQRYEGVEHMVTMAKIAAHRALNRTNRAHLLE